MTIGRPSPVARALTWLAVAISITLLILGVSWYGWSPAVHDRFWSDILGRLHGPMTFRFALQPTMAAIAAIPDGIADARLAPRPFLGSASSRPGDHGGRLRQGLTSIVRVVLLGISMDAIYQFRVFDRFYPVEALMMAVLLAVVPYFALRWIVERVARRWFARAGSVPRA